jgi:citrate lyase beta subunit
MRHLQLGASLYVPATRDDLVAIGNRRKYPRLRSAIFCTEDSVSRSGLSRAIDNLRAALRCLEPADILRFIRVRDPTVLRFLLRMEGIDRINGFVLPKVTLSNLDDYFSLFSPSDRFEIMLTLETIEVFDSAAMTELRNRLLQSPYRDRILALRIGGNDLFNLLGLRRPRARTIYQTPLGVTIAQLVTTFRPHGFNLTAPVFEFLDRSDLLAREAKFDVSYGLIGKTAIHPTQIPVIEAQYRVNRADLRAAELILKQTAPPVFRLQDAMCEPATHRAWATIIRTRSRIYGVAEINTDGMAGSLGPRTVTSDEM